jgi:hypothetical protein
MICAKVLAVGPGKSFSVCIGQADFENDCSSSHRISVIPQGNIDPFFGNGMKI